MRRLEVGLPVVRPEISCDIVENPQRVAEARPRLLSIARKRCEFAHPITELPAEFEHSCVLGETERVFQEGSDGGFLCTALHADLSDGNSTGENDGKQSSLLGLVDQASDRLKVSSGILPCPGEAVQFDLNPPKVFTITRNK